MSEVSFKEQHLFRLHAGLVPPSPLTADTALPIWSVVATLCPRLTQPTDTRIVLFKSGDTFDFKSLLNFVWGQQDHLSGYILLISPLKVPHLNVCDILSVTLKTTAKTTWGARLSKHQYLGGGNNSHCSQNIKSKCCYSAAIINMSGLKHFIVQITVKADWIRWLQYFWVLWLVITHGMVSIMNWFPHVNSTCWGCKNAEAT